MGKGNINNLVKNEELTPEERRRNASKAGKKSGEVRAAKKTMREMLDYLLEKQVENKHGEKITTREAILIAAVAKAGKGDIKAIEFIRDTIGEKPVDKVLNDVTLTQALVVFDDAKPEKVH